MITPAQFARATWHQNSPSTMILKCCIKDGSAVLATITKYHHFLWVWSLEGGGEGGHATTRHTAMRRARVALREGIEI